MQKAKLFASGEVLHVDFDAPTHPSTAGDRALSMRLAAALVLCACSGCGQIERSGVAGGGGAAGLGAAWFDTDNGGAQAAAGAAGKPQAGGAAGAGTPSAPATRCDVGQPRVSIWSTTDGVSETKTPDPGCPRADAGPAYAATILGVEISGSAPSVMPSLSIVRYLHGSATSCAASLRISTPDFFLAFHPGEEARFSYYVPDHAVEVPSDAVAIEEEGKLAAVFFRGEPLAGGERATSVLQDLGLKLALTPAPPCSGTLRADLGVALIAGEEECVVPDRGATCCTLWGQRYEARAATTSSSDNGAVFAEAAIVRADRIRATPPAPAACGSP